MRAFPRRRRRRSAAQPSSRSVSRTVAECVDVLARPEVGEVLISTTGRRITREVSSTTCASSARQPEVIRGGFAPFVIVQDADLEYDPNDYGGVRRIDAGRCRLRQSVPCRCILTLVQLTDLNLTDRLPP